MASYVPHILCKCGISLQIVRLGLKESIGLVCPLNRGLTSPRISEFRSLLKCLFNGRSEVMSRGNVSWVSSSVPQGDTVGCCQESGLQLCTRHTEVVLVLLLCWSLGACTPVA